MTRQLHLNLFIYPGGHHEAAWRHPDSQPDRILDIDFYLGLARRAEAATFDGIFFADGPSLPGNVRYASRFRIEPLTWLSAIADSHQQARADRHCVDDLHRAVQPGQTVRVAGPPEQGSRRVEHRHNRWR